MHLCWHVLDPLAKPQIVPIYLRKHNLNEEWHSFLHAGSLRWAPSHARVLNSDVSALNIQSYSGSAVTHQHQDHPRIFLYSLLPVTNLTCSKTHSISAQLRTRQCAACISQKCLESSKCPHKWVYILAITQSGPRVRLAMQLKRWISTPGIQRVF